MDYQGSILLVDDEETFREATRRLLLRQGFECRCACNADEAVAGLRERRFDVMIADIRMPGNPDLRVVHAARDLDRHMSVVLVTGYPSAETAIRGIDLSVAAYMTKPLDFDALLGHVRSAIEHSRKRRALAAIRERLQTCLADLETGCSGPASGANEPSECVSISTIRTLAACLSELLTLAARSGMEGGGSQNLCELLDCPQQPIHRQVLIHAVEVLKKTKDTFKSKALADLRKQIEQLLGRGEGIRGHD